MNECTYHDELEAYHDGELAAAARLELEQHLPTCDPCASELAELREVSGWFAAAPKVKLSQIALHRIHAGIGLLTDRGLIKIARVLTAIAASVLVVGSLWLMRAKPAAAATTPGPSLIALLDESAATPADPGPSDWVMTELAK